MLFVTGKGGVGKTSVAAAIGLIAAREGKRTLVCEVDAKGALAASFQSEPFGFAPSQVRDGLFAMTMNTEDSLREYLALQLRLPLLARIGPLARTLDFIASAAPGVKEILTIGKLCYEVRERHYDLVVVDAVATGHIVGQLSAPQSINALVQVGVVRDQTRWMLDILDDPARTGLTVVTTPEEMPVHETIDLAHRLTEHTNVEVSAVIVNRVLPELFGHREEEIFEALRRKRPASILERELGPGTSSVLDAAELAVSLRRTGASHLAELRAALPGMATMYVPELFAKASGMRLTAMLADRLSEELS